MMFLDDDASFFRLSRNFHEENKHILSLYFHVRNIKRDNAEVRIKLELDNQVSEWNIALIVQILKSERTPAINCQSTDTTKARRHRDSEVRYLILDVWRGVCITTSHYLRLSKKKSNHFSDERDENKKNKYFLFQFEFICQCELNCFATWSSWWNRFFGNLRL